MTYNGLLVKYDYNSRSELLSAESYLAGASADKYNPLAALIHIHGRSFHYGYDESGNRSYSSVDGHQTNYTAEPTFFNQYSKIGYPGATGNILMRSRNTPPSMGGKTSGASPSTRSRTGRSAAKQSPL